MKTPSLASLLLLLMTLILTTCEKPVRDNPWDELADPATWAPKNLTHSINSLYSITLSWEYHFNSHKGFQLERKTNNGDWIIIASEIIPIELSFTDTQIDLTQNDFIYRLSAFTNGFYSNYAYSSEIIHTPNVTNPVTGETWMDRNLGASRVAQKSNDEQAYGDLYQWGRDADGHEKRSSGFTSTLSSTDTTSHELFIRVNGVNNYNNDWRSPQNNNLWQGVNGINNPCPPGYRIPTDMEWESERQSWSSNDANGAFNSQLKLPVAGCRNGAYGSLDGVASNGHYWSATIIVPYARRVYFDNINTGMINSWRSYGYSIRCIKD